MDVPSREFDVGPFNLHLKWFLFVVLTLWFFIPSFRGLDQSKRKQRNID